MSELQTDQPFELWLWPAAFKIPPSRRPSLHQLFLNDTHYLNTHCVHCYCDGGHHIGWWLQQMLLPLLGSALTTECQWADSDAMLVLMFDGGWFQATLLTVETQNKNWLCCATMVRLWETLHWSKACDLCLFAARGTDWHMFHLPASGRAYLCCSCLRIHIRMLSVRHRTLTVITHLLVNTFQTDSIPVGCFQDQRGQSPDLLWQCRILGYITSITWIISVFRQRWRRIIQNTVLMHLWSASTATDFLYLIQIISTSLNMVCFIHHFSCSDSVQINRLII